jgi:hypothetical protein
VLDGFSSAPGTFRIELELRYSESSASGTDLDGAYTVAVDGVPQPLVWTKRGTAIFGNAYFGLALTAPIDLSGKTHSITITTSRPWCSVRKHFRLVRAD